MIRTAILGGSGYAGGELLRLLCAHPSFTPTKIFGSSKVGQTLRTVHPHLAKQVRDLEVEEFAPDAMSGIDLMFAALPHGRSQQLAATILDSGTPFVDLGADFRLDDAAEYQRWYGTAHQAPGLLGSFTYGIPEINRAAIRGAKAVAAAGCYATAAILALKPLIDAGLIDREGVIVDAASGVSGAGREAKEATGFSTVDGSFAAYGLVNHRHTAEMEMALGASLLFTPHLAPMTRGILATCYATAARPLAPDEPLEALHAAYREEPFVEVGPDAPATKWVTGSNSVRITARYDARTNRVLAISAIDNLGKGAAGQMIQCANLMLGIEETAGLAASGVYP